MKRTFAILIIFISIHSFAQTPAFEFNKKLGIGVNMGNMFEAPTETEWGNPWKTGYFKIIKDMGFNHVRIPVRWEPAARSSATPPYLITQTFFTRIKQVVDEALSNHLIAIINMHHHDVLLADVTGQKERFLSQWTQIAAYFKNYSDSLVFEVLNEPTSSITPEIWNGLFVEALQKIRVTNPNRYVLMGTAEWGGLGGLSKLVLPADPYIIQTIHYYNPFTFTHQGASWAGPDADSWLGTKWLNTAQERETMQNEFAPLVAFSKKYNIPVHIGEFGAYEKADMASRIRWTNYLARYFGELGFSCAYWEFSAGFGIYDPVAKNPRQGLLDALLNDPMYPVSETILNQLYKDEFKLTTTDWQLYTQQTGNATRTLQNDEIQIVVNNGSTETWHVQLAKNNVKIEKDKMYLLSFTARSTGDRTINAYIGKSSSPYTAYSGGSSFLLTTEKKAFSFTFQMKESTDLASRIVFDLGKSTEDFFLDEVTLSEVTVKINSGENPLIGTLKDKNGNIMRGTPMVLGKSLSQSVAFAQDIENWKTIQNNGYNTIRVCWVDPWYKNHSQNSWTVTEVLPYLDKCVENATATGMNLIINFHNVGAQQEFDKTYQFTLENEFWNAVAPRYKDNDLVYYEPANEPTFTMSDYLKADFKDSYLKLYNTIRTLAPDRQILFFSFNGITSEIVNVVENYKDQIDWKHTTIAYHMYNSTTSAAVKTLMEKYPVICTEWFYDHVSKLPGNEFIKQVDGYKENAQTLEKIGSGWIDWRDWGDITLNELVDTLITDARAKNYWWGKPVAGLKVTGISIFDKKLELVSGQSKKPGFFVYPALAEDQKVSWTTSNADMVSVDTDGKITAVSSRSGSAVVTAKTSDGGFTATCQVTVLASESKVAYPDGNPHKMPGTINATYYDQGGEGVGYHDLTKTNDGDGIRQEQGVDTEFRLPEGTIGGIGHKEWLEYTVEVLQDGNYTFEILFATAGRYGKFHLEFDGVDKTGQVSVASTGSYSKFAITKIEGIALNKGKQVLRIYFDYAEYNMGSISVTREIPSGIIQPEAGKVILFPNPTRNKLFISGNKQVKKYAVYSLPGQIMKRGNIADNQAIDLKYLAKGNYFIRLEGDDFIQTEKLIKL
jgi:endoglucanase